MDYTDIIKHLGTQREFLLIIQADFNASHKLDFLYIQCLQVPLVSPLLPDLSFFILIFLCWYEILWDPL